MGNHQSSTSSSEVRRSTRSSSSSSRYNNRHHDKHKYKGFPGSAFLEKAFCGSIDTTDPSEYEGKSLAHRLLKKADIMCVSSPKNNENETNDSRFFLDDNDNNNNNSHHHSHHHHHMNPSSALLARALVSEVTDNPKTMKQSDMTRREYQLLKAQQKAAEMSHQVAEEADIAGIGGGNVAKRRRSKSKPVGAPGKGVGPPNVVSSLAFACTGNEETSASAHALCVAPQHEESDNNSTDILLVPVPVPSTASPAEQRTRRTPLSSSSSKVATAHHYGDARLHQLSRNPYAVAIGISMSRHDAKTGHPMTITRQMQYDFNELQDRSYKYVSSITDAYGWRAGGGEPPTDGDNHNTLQQQQPSPSVVDNNQYNTGFYDHQDEMFGGSLPPTPPMSPTTMAQQQQVNNKNHKLASGGGSPDTVHIPIIYINCPNQDAVDQVIHALASGEVFIPHMSVQPESLGVNDYNNDSDKSGGGRIIMDTTTNTTSTPPTTTTTTTTSPPDLVVRFGCERNDDLPEDEWPNWCLEFMHNQLYEYFYNTGAQWMKKRPFGLTLARQVKWKTVKHMNRYFSHCEKVIDTWREQGPQYLTPQLSYIEGGATPEEVARPHGIYLFRPASHQQQGNNNGGGSSSSSSTVAAAAAPWIPTNYFAPNFEPPYTTKMTRSLLRNVLDKSWSVRRREWMDRPGPKLVTPSMLMAAACGCADPNSGGFMATEVTRKSRAAATAAGNKNHRGSKNQVSPMEKQRKQQQQQQQRASPSVNKHRDNKNQVSVVEKQQQQLHQEQRQRRQGYAISTKDDDDHHHAEEKRLEEELPRNQESTREERAGTTDNDAAAAAAAASSSSRPRTLASMQEEGDAAARSVAATSGYATSATTYAMSLAASGTTVLHTNTRTAAAAAKVTAAAAAAAGSSNKPRLLVYSSEDDSEDDQSVEKGPFSDPPGEKVTSHEWIKKKNTSTSLDSLESALEEERQHHSELIAKVKQTTVETTRKPLANSNLSDVQAIKDAERRTKTGYTMQAVTMTRKDPAGHDGSESAFSLEYSTDGSSAFLTAEGSALHGQQFAGDGSVLTTGSNNNNNTQSPRKEAEDEDDLDPVIEVEEAASSASLSMRTSTATSSYDESIIPTDEELFSIGWAKAMDPKTGIHYYFTLDRSKTAWENPLSMSGSLGESLM